MIFVLGGNGFVGSAYIRHYRNLGVPVESISKENYAHFVGEKCDVLINANGNSKKFLAIEDPKFEFQASVASVRNSLVDFSYQQYVYLSTSDVYGDFSTPCYTDEAVQIDISRLSTYGFHKYLAELCVQHGAENWIIIRQGSFVGVGMKKNAVFDALWGEKIWLHSKSQFQFMSTDESARVVSALISKRMNHEIFNLSAKGTISVQDILSLARRSVPTNEEISPVHYEIALAKISQHASLNDSYNTVKYYISNEMSKS